MTQSPNVESIEIDLFLQAIYLRYHYDFRGYARSSLKRRVQLACERFGCASVAALQDRVLHDPAIFHQLLSFLTIQVSDMFRDTTFFRALREKVAPLLQTYPSLKVWSAGCSTGEEVYSLAILFHEAGLLERTTIYATDVTEGSLAKAEAGVYAIDRIAAFSKNYVAAGGTGTLSDYYKTAYDAAIFDKSLRANIVFADHSLATDTVFTETHLITCRNVLIYFGRVLQDRAIGLFRESLCRGGFFGLGARETLAFSSHAPAFTEFDRDVRIYRKAP